MNLKKKLLIFMKTCSCKLGRKIASVRFEKCEEYLSEFTAEENMKKIKEHMKGVETEEGNISQLKVWKLKKKTLQHNQC